MGEKVKESKYDVTESRREDAGIRDERGVGRGERQIEITGDSETER